MYKTLSNIDNIIDCKDVLFEDEVLLKKIERNQLKVYLERLKYNKKTTNIFKYTTNRNIFIIDFIPKIII